MQQYFSKKKENNLLFINEDDVHHIKNVMRIKPDGEILVCYEKVIYLCSLNDDYRSVNIKSVYKEGTESIYVVAYIPVLPEEKMSFVIEKGTELGVSEFVPVNFSHSKFVIPKDKEVKKLERWNRISKEASEQSRRLIIPKVNHIVNVNDVNVVSGVNLLCSLDKLNVKPVKEVLNLDSMCDTMSLVFGPEGGISELEEDILERKGFTKVTLGNNILRTETVIINVCSIINYLNG
jgi:16S rRNA (uracil1498-N3)-methyltransferase